ncbi:MAG TPA: exonuclease domain-containing protein [Spirochaetota bacterium]|nr:exonuclease domain-containing protein [Spirochaetota bacterium]HPI88219.1 exonuclease domain-containing protein [Spirochaetota bacterium]HPR47237.1 exonuclease domain-containing protein [Spirochaetota bacterium]
MLDYGKNINEAVFCAVDLETTGVNPLLHHIVEVGLVKFTREKVIETYECLVNPGTSIPEEVIRIHGITDDMVAGSPSIMEIIGTVSEFIGDSYLVIHNPAFDLAFLDASYRKGGMDASSLIAFDTVRLARKTFPYFDNHKLTTLSRHFNLSGTSHRALSDACCCMEIFRRVVANPGPHKMKTMGDLLGYHGSLIRPGPKKAVKRQRIHPGLMIGRMARIRYEDNDGNITVRDIVPKEFITQGRKSYLFAHCYLRREDRYFRTESILEVL